MRNKKIKPTLELADELANFAVTDPEIRKLLDHTVERLRDLHRYLGECRNPIQCAVRLSSAVTYYLIMLDQLHERPDDPLMKQIERDAMEEICNTHPAAREAIRDLGVSMITTWKKPLWKIYEPEEEGEGDE